MSKGPALEPQHWRYIQLRLLGMTNAECAVELQIDPATAWRWGCIPAVKDELAKLQQDAVESTHRILKSGLAKAARKVGELVDSDDENVALKAACWTLERMPAVAEDLALNEAPTTGDPWE